MTYMRHFHLKLQLQYHTYLQHREYMMSGQLRLDMIQLRMRYMLLHCLRWTWRFQLDRQSKRFRGYYRLLQPLQNIQQYKYLLLRSSMNLRCQLYRYLQRRSCISRKSYCLYLQWSSQLRKGCRSRRFQQLTLRCRQDRQYKHQSQCSL